MILIVTSKNDLTADYLILRLKERSIPYFRLNTEDLPSKLEGAAHFPDVNFTIKNEVKLSVNSAEISGIWYRRPQMSSLIDDIDPQIVSYIREDSWFFINGLLELTNNSVVWVSRPENIRRAENKLYQLKIAHNSGFRIPTTFIGNSPDGLRKLLDSSPKEEKAYIVKPIRSGRYFFDNQTRIFYTSNFPDEWEPIEIKVWPVIVQDKIAKKRDIRVTIFHNKIFSVGINSSELSEQIQLDWRRAIDQVKYTEVDLPLEISNRLLKILQIMGLSFGAFDLIETPEGEYVFLELNPNGQWAWMEEKSGFPMRDALIQVLQGGYNAKSKI